MEFLSDPVNWLLMAALVAWYLLQGRGEDIWKAVDTWLGRKERNERRFEHRRYLIRETETQERLLEHLVDRTKRLLGQDPQIEHLQQMEFSQFGLAQQVGPQQDPLAEWGLGPFPLMGGFPHPNYTELTGLQNAAPISTDEVLRRMQQG